MTDVCAIVVSHEGRDWLDGAIGTLIEHSSDISLDVVVVDNGSDGAAEYAERRFPGVRAIRCPNHGFGHANNRGLEAAQSRYVLFLNPDTEVVEGELGALVAALDARPEVGLAGARQVRPDGSLAPSIRRFPSPTRMLAEALGAERVPLAGARLGERELVERNYERVTACDWTSGSFMLARATALAEVGWFDERFFLFSEETDLCWRLKRGGWEVLHLPELTILHHEQEHWTNARLEAQSAYARLQFARKNLRRPALYRAVLALRYWVRWVSYAVPGRREPRRRAAAAAALRTVLTGRPPFG
ncbi:MAG TPA: glycosyltransferase family 2 protein [Solirubrobacterales bacterium]|nr:glycosyltransferase family 2 protein [Solirubrobacterales bacterium]